MFQNEYYSFIVLVLLVVPLLAAFTFYYLWNPLYGDWRHWLVATGGGAILSAGIIHMMLNQFLARFITAPKGFPQASTYLWQFTLWALVLAVISGIIWSYIIKWKSLRNKYEPL
jgi:hypothetical protein